MPIRFFFRSVMTTGYRGAQRILCLRARKDDCLIVFVDFGPLLIVAQQARERSVRRDQHGANCKPLESFEPPRAAVVGIECFVHELIAVNVSATAAVHRMYAVKASYDMSA